METEPNSAPAPVEAESPPLEPTLEPTRAGPLAVGDRIDGHLAEIGAGGARLALADGRDVSIDLAELDQGTPPELGEAISAFVVRVDPGGEVWVSRTPGSAVLQLLLNARNHGLTVEGRVVAQGPSGLEVDLGGGVYAICPPQEIGDDVDNPGHLVGQTVTFKVKEATEAQVVLTRQAPGAPGTKPAGQGPDPRAEEAADTRRRLRVGAVMAGRITRIREFGAFVDLGGGVEGLIHLSELAHQRVSSPKEVVQPGQAVEVQVLKLDYDAHKGERISLSLKAMLKSHWEAFTTGLKEGTKLPGRVTRLEPFGAFVELSPGITGLIHSSAMGVGRGGKRHTPADQLLKVDEPVQVEVLGVEHDKRRISLKRIPSEAEVAEKRAAQAALREQKRAEAREKREEARKKPHERLQPGEVVEAVVDRIEPYGFFLQLKGGGRGMVHVSEMGPAPEGADAQKPVSEQFPKGTKVKVAVLEIDAEHRIRLSRAAVEAIEKGTTAEAYLKAKTQHELEEKLLRSAAKPARAPARPGARPGGRPAGAGAGRGAPSSRRPSSPGEAGPGALAGAAGEGAPSERAPRRERPAPRAAGRPGSGPPSGPGGRPSQPRGEPRGFRPEPYDKSFLKTEKATLGTLGDLLKLKLQQRKS